MLSSDVYNSVVAYSDCWTYRPAWMHSYVKIFCDLLRFGPGWSTIHISEPCFNCVARKISDIVVPVNKVADTIYEVLITY